MYKIIYTIAVFMGLLTMTLSAQQTHNPVSNSGIGEFLDTDQTVVSTQGYNSNVFNDFYHINLNNPASYSYLRSTSFEFGISARKSNWTNDNGSYQYWSGQLDNISLAFPVFSPYNDLMEKRDRKIYWGMGFGLTPYTQISYNYQFTTDEPGVGSTRYGQGGRGGTYKFIWNNGLSFKNISLGVGAQYLFGKIEKRKEIDFSDYTDLYNYISAIDNDFYLSGLQWNLAANYQYTFNPITDGKPTDVFKKKQLTFGATFQPLSQIKSSKDGVSYTYNTQTGTAFGDTISFTQGAESKHKFSTAYGAGIQYAHGSAWKINANYDATDFSNYEIEGLEADYRKSGLLKLGVEICPDANSYGSFFKRVKYRAGFKSGTLPTTFQNEQTAILAGTVGIGMPLFVNRQISHINIGVEMGRKSFGNQYQENYFRVSCAFNLNDDYWFLKRRFN